MPKQADDVIISNLTSALARLHDDLDRVELWTAALACFNQPPPDYTPTNDYLLPPHERHRRGE